MASTTSSRIPQTSVSLALVFGLVLMTWTPFALALEIHHVFAEVDHDGHEHSEFDLCTWVQQHTSGSPILDFFELKTWLNLKSFSFIFRDRFFSSPIIHHDSSRAPPLS